VLRIYDTESGSNKPFEIYDKSREIESIYDRILTVVLLELITRGHEQVKSSQKLEDFEDRDLSDNDFISLLIDSKYLAKEQIIIMLGVILKGDKIPIGFIQSNS
jgi:hypothetical protein